MQFTDEWFFIKLAYTVTWVALLGYTVYLARLAKRAEQDYEAARNSGKGKS